MTDEREPGTVGPSAAEPETTEPTSRAPTFLDSAPAVDPDTTAKYGAAPSSAAPASATTDKIGAEPLRAPAKPAARPETELPTKVFEGPTAVFEKEPATVQVKKSEKPSVPSLASAAKPPKPAIEVVDDPPAARSTPAELPLKPRPETAVADEPPPRARAKTPAPAPAVAPPGRREAPSVYVVGFWKRLLAATVDLAIVIPAAVVMTLIVSKIAGVHLPPSNLKVLDIDMWIDLVLATDPALVMGIVMFLAIGLIYLLVFQIVVGRTLGMRLLRMKIIDVYGERPSPGRCALRCGGYLASVATLFLGFLWMGFDSEKRGLQDWIAGTYVIRA
jgi:uncharacterized RDD family membrane protein YckC